LIFFDQGRFIQGCFQTPSFKTFGCLFFLFWHANVRHLALGPWLPRGSGLNIALFSFFFHILSLVFLFSIYPHLIKSAEIYKSQGCHHLARKAVKEFLNEESRRIPVESKTSVEKSAAKSVK
jgi:hypothetical protein